MAPRVSAESLAAILRIDASLIEVQPVADRLWEREWLQDFHALRFGRRLWIYPWNIEPPADGDIVVVRLDPGLAFGSGTHPAIRCMANRCFG